MVGLQAALLDAGYASVALNFRGCSGTPNNTWRAYHSGETEDLEWVLKTLRSRYPGRSLLAVGFSLGGNVLLKYLGEAGVTSLLDAAVAVSVPLRLDWCATRLDQGLSRIYRNRLITELKTYVLHKHRHLKVLGKAEDAEKIEALGSLKPVRSFWDYDHQVVARLYGFESAEDYYAKSSSFGYLKGIQTPTLLIQALNDPFLVPGMTPKDSDHSKALTVESPRSGGHVGFVGGDWPWRPDYWIERRILDYFSASQPPNRLNNQNRIESPIETPREIPSEK
jgi:predicted alpha/beta-fold hydrolase